MSTIEISTTATASGQVTQGNVASAGTGSAERFHYLDNLRAIAMLGGVFLHAALAYAEPARSIWLATDGQGSVVIDAAIWFIHLFRMSLFFLLSGYFGKLLWSRRGEWGYVKGRLLRIALPFAIFYPILWGGLVVVIVFALSYLKAPEGIMGVIAEGVKQQKPNNNETTFTTMHLWFLYYLMMFVLLSVPLARIKNSWSVRIIESRVGLALLPLLLAGAVMLTDVPLPAPESFMPAVWPFLFYGTFYWLGWQVYGREILLEQWEKRGLMVLAVCLALYVPYYLLMPSLVIETIFKPDASPPLWKKLILAGLTGYLSLGLTLSSIGLGKRFLKSNRSLLRFLADSSYWVYLVHLPLVMGLQTFLIPIAISIWLKLAIVIVATMFFALLSYVVLVRYTPVGWMLHGKRNFP